MVKEVQVSLLNRSECKKTVLGFAETKWPGKFTRVSQDVFEYLETCLRTDIIQLIQEHPTVGKTIQMRTHKRKGDNEKADS